MPRITCRQVSPGKPLNLVSASIGTNFATLAEANDFSLPDPQLAYPVRDPLDATRGIAAGALFFLRPLYVYNTTTTARWIEVRLLTEGGAAIDALGRFTVPGRETVAVPVQGISLVKRSAVSANGDRLQLRAEATSTFHVWAIASERLAAEHIGVV